MKFDSEPKISVGILRLKEPKYLLHGEYSEKQLPGGCVAMIPADSACWFELSEVTIGIGFHWERKEAQRFSGALRLLPDGDSVVVINDISLEEYLKSVISSEMSGNASLELLKAHSVISRSWLLAMLEHRESAVNNVDKELRTGRSGCQADDAYELPEICRWYDREDHLLFDVCADDHCQRYQGITRQTNPNVARAVDDTRGTVLTFDGKICDARFSKCCGGFTEVFEACWEPVSHPYLTSVEDDFCNTSDKEILSQVLNSYDREQLDFYQWTQRYSAEELADLVARKTGYDFGMIKELRPLSRGKSGRITRLLIRGERHSVVIGKELEIRRTLSENCLRSSAFDVEQTPDGGFVINGRGWGHGVGLCQIGAAVMGARGYGYTEILKHYFPNAQIQKIYG